MGTPHRVYSLRGLVHPSHRQHMLVGTVCVISIVDPCSFLVSFSPAVFSQHSSPPQLMSQKDQSHLLLLLISLFEPELHYSPPLSHDPALRGDFRNPHSQNMTYLHQRRKDGNKSYPSETKTVQILLWPGRRPSFHFNHFETFSLT